MAKRRAVLLSKYETIPETTSGVIDAYIYDSSGNIKAIFVTDTGRILGVPMSMLCAEELLEDDRGVLRKM